MNTHTLRSPIDTDAIHCVIQDAISALLKEQTADGSWRYGFEMGVTPDAQTAIFLYLLDYPDVKWTQSLLIRLLALQNPDGSWGSHEGAVGDLSTTVECYYALHLYDGWSSFPRERAAAERFILQSGGIHACRNLTKVILAIGGEISWTKLPAPALYAWLWSPLSPVQMSDVVMFTRLHVASMVILSAHRYVSPAANVPKLAHLFTEQRRRNWSSYRLPVPRHLLRRCLQYLQSEREDDGTLAGYHSSTFLFLFAQCAEGISSNHEAFRQTIHALRRTWGCPFGVATQHQQTCDAHIWNTALTLRALREAGISAQHPTYFAGAHFLLNHQHQGQWDAYRKRCLLAGGWGFSSNNTRHADTDDTVACLEALIHTSFQGSAPFQDGVQWLMSRQNRDGGWSAFDQNCGKRWMERIPANDMRHAIADPSTPDITARVIEFLVDRQRVADDHPILRRALKWLLLNQEPDGTWYGRWGATYLYGTWCAVRALCVCRQTQQPSIVSALARARAGLLRIQRQDGGFGESCHSDELGHYDPLDQGLPSQTAWGLDALLCLYEREESILEKRRLLQASTRSAAWLIDAAEGGTWKETLPTGSAFPGAMHIRYHLYPKIWPLFALAHYRNLEQ